METEKQVEFGSWLDLQRAFATVAGDAYFRLSEIARSQVRQKAGSGR